MDTSYWYETELINKGLELARGLIKNFKWNQDKWDREIIREKKIQIETLLRTLNQIDLSNVDVINQLAVFLHVFGSLREAGEYYDELLNFEVIEPLTDKKKELVRRFAPELYLVKSEPFVLRNCIAILHPTKPMIGYHLFWEDDWDFPDDNDSADHEIIWVCFNPNTLEVTKVYTYFHQHILTSSQADIEAKNSGNCAKIFVQWGKHGSLISGYDDIKLIIETGLGLEKHTTVREYLKRDYEHSLKGGRVPEHPIKQEWPKSFEGGFADYLTFENRIDLREFFEKKNRIFTSIWANAVISQKALSYNVHPKKDWPDSLMVIL